MDAWRNCNSTDVCGREGFRDGPLLDYTGSMQPLVSSHVRDRDKALLRGILSGRGGGWCGEKTFLVGFVRVQMGWSVLILLWFISEIVLSSTLWCTWTSLANQGVYFGMASLGLKRLVRLP